MSKDNTFDRVDVVTEPIPCGEAHKTRYYKDGVLVREDVEIRVIRGIELQADTGKVG